MKTDPYDQWKTEFIPLNKETILDIIIAMGKMLEQEEEKEAVGKPGTWVVRDPETNEMVRVKPMKIHQNRLNDFDDPESFRNYLLEVFDASERDVRHISELIASAIDGDGWSENAFFLYRCRLGKLWEVHASHCSCFGFDGQWEPEETSVEALLERKSFGPICCDDSVNRLKDYLRKME